MTCNRQHLKWSNQLAVTDLDLLRGPPDWGQKRLTFVPDQYGPLYSVVVLTVRENNIKTFEKDFNLNLRCSRLKFPEIIELMYNFEPMFGIPSLSIKEKILFPFPYPFPKCQTLFSNSSSCVYYPAAKLCTYPYPEKTVHTTLAKIY